MTAKGSRPPVWLRHGARELRGGLKGFRIFLACLALGVAAVAAVGSISAAFVAGLDAEAQALLGGDVEVALTHRPMTEEARAYLAARGTVSDTITMRAMARTGADGPVSLVELKGVDTAYPLYGSLALEGGMDLDAALARRGGRFGAAVEETVLTRLGLSVGDTLRLGTLYLDIRAVIEDEPDRATGGFSLGPRVLVRFEAVRATGLVQVGSLVRYRTRIQMPDPAAPAVKSFVGGLKAAFPEAEWQIRDRSGASEGLARMVANVGVFLTFVGLTALVVGGVGVGNATRSYLDSKRATIATLKTLGADGGSIFATYLVQILALAGVGVALGLGLGVLAPFAVGALYGEILPIPARFAVYPGPLAVAALYGLLTALAFTIWPLARAREIPAASLYRSLTEKVTIRPRPFFLWLGVGAFAALAGLAFLVTDNREFAAVFILGAIAVFGGLTLTSRAVRWAAARARGGRVPELRLALANLHRPGAVTDNVVVSLGLGLTLLVTVSLIDANLLARVKEQLPKNAPEFFFVDIQKAQLEPFRALARGTEGVGEIRDVANLRGRVVRIGGVLASDAEVDPGGRWALRGDRGVTYAAALPEGTELVAGKWWDAEHSGPPLLSMEAELAREFGVGVGDTMTLNVLGREITAEIANLRVVHWDRIGINFLFILSPGVLEGAPFTHLATVQTDAAAEEALQRAVIAAFPNVTAVRVKEALSAVNKILSDLGLAVRVTSAVTLVAGVLVLAGAITSGRRQRVYDAVVLKVLGATRGRILKILLAEYAVLGAATALIAAAAGTLAAWFVVARQMEAPFAVFPGTVLLTVGASAALTILMGLLGTWSVLGQKPAPVLRAE